ncbi:hypothetical protein UJ101_01949 [Flavobacteriaceae bacterium UJ101]|nr:hypothetical protein UJ101_01949 [Flavobacteriaceae bacterium UJ101]
MKKPIIYNLIELNIAMLLISTSGPLGRFIDLAPPVTIWFRALFACFIIGGYCVYKKISFKINFKQDGFLLLLGGVLMGGHWISYFYALHYSNVAIGMLSLFTFPVITIFLEPFFFKTSINIRQIGLGFMVLIGVYLLAPTFSLESSYTIGILFGLFSAVLYSVRNLLIKNQIKKYNSSLLMWIQMLVITLFFTPVLAFFEYDFEEIQWLPIVSLALFTTAIGHSLFVKSLNHFTVGTASIIGSIQPIYGIILAMIFLQEYPTYRTLLGGSLILGTVIIESYRSIRVKK